MAASKAIIFVMRINENKTSIIFNTDTKALNYFGVNSCFLIFALFVLFAHEPMHVGRRIVAFR